MAPPPASFLLFSSVFTDHFGFVTPFSAVSPTPPQRKSAQRSPAPWPASIATAAVTKPATTIPRHHAAAPSPSPSTPTRPPPLAPIRSRQPVGAFFPAPGGIQRNLASHAGLPRGLFPPPRHRRRPPPPRGGIHPPRPPMSRSDTSAGEGPDFANSSRFRAAPFQRRPVNLSTGPRLHSAPFHRLKLSKTGCPASVSA